MNSDKALTNASLELTQKIQMHFPRDLDHEVVQAWNGQPSAAITAICRMAFEKLPMAAVPAPAAEPLPPILRFGALVIVPARAKRFVPREKYVVNTRPGKHVKIGYIAPDFITAFGDKVEEPTEEVVLRYDILDRQSAFASAVKELSDQGVVTKTTPGELWSMLEKQPDGPKSKAGPLLANGYANLSEMVGSDNVSRLVSVSWFDFFDGWDVYASPVTDSIQWDAGSQLFSRNSRRELAA
jgi:hypothetical protein